MNGDIAAELVGRDAALATGDVMWADAHIHVRLADCSLNRSKTCAEAGNDRLGQVRREVLR